MSIESEQKIYLANAAPLLKATQLDGSTPSESVVAGWIDHGTLEGHLTQGVYLESHAALSGDGRRTTSFDAVKRFLYNLGLAGSA